MLTGLGRERARYASRDTLHKGLYSALLLSLYNILGWDREALISLDHSHETKVIRVGTLKGISGKLRAFSGVSPSLGLEGVWGQEEKVLSWCLRYAAPQQLAFWCGGVKTNPLREYWGFALPPAWPGTTDPLRGLTLLLLIFCL